MEASAGEALQLGEHWGLGWQGLHGQRLGHELEGGRRGSWRVLVGQGVEGFQGRRRGEVGGHLRKRGSGEVRRLLV